MVRPHVGISHVIGPARLVIVLRDLLEVTIHAQRRFDIRFLTQLFVYLVLRGTHWDDSPPGSHLHVMSPLR